MIMLTTRIKLWLLRLNPDFHLTFQNRRVIFFGVIPFVVASILYRLISDRIRFERLEKEARAERLAAELKFLRSQISPHFLFNTMTNMVSLARKKSDLMEPSLIKLSDLLRYMLYDSVEGAIAVGAEIEQLENYIGLQQLRFGEDVKLDLKIDNDCPDCKVEPMLLVPFIENAYKHGIGMVRYPYIKISVAVKNKMLDFYVENNYNSENHSKDKNTGIGLENVKNRLKYLYPGKYNLVISDNEQIFSAHLKLDLS
jgi:two-component system, LytTR family, sensor kinase